MTIPMRAAVLGLLMGCGRLDFTNLPAVDASGSDAGDAAPAEPCPALPGLIFCESFEGGSGLTIQQGTVDIDEARAFRGTHSQHAATTGLSEASWQIGLVLPSVMSGDLYARWYNYVPSTIANAQLATVHLVDNDFPYHGIIYGLRDGNAEVSSSEAAMTLSSTMQVPRDRWVCAQMHVFIADAGGSIDGAIDGQALGAITNIDTLPVGGYRNVHAGLYATALATEPMELWTDEVAVGTQPIPCD